MSAGKNPYHRYYILNACFTNRQKREWTKAELIRKLEDHDFVVSGRTLDGDIYNMRYDDRLKFYAPITFCKKAYAYYYTDPDYSIDKLQLTDEQLRAFESIVLLMQPYKGTQIVQEFEGAIEKIVRGVDQLRRRTLTSDRQTIAVEQAPYYKGHTRLDAIKKAIDDQQPLRIRYQKFTTDKVDEHIFHPYLLKEYKGRWYALGYSEKRHFTITLGLDRMEDVETVDKAYRENKKLKVDNFFKNTIGITNPQGKVEEILLWFSPTMSPYIKTQHLHASQEIVEDTAQGLIIRLRLVVNYELTSLLLSFVPDVAILEPVELKERFLQVLNKGMEVNAKAVLS